MAGTYLNKTIHEIVGGTNGESIKYDPSDSRWKYSNDGVNFQYFGSGSGDGYINYVNISQLTGSDTELYVYDSPSVSGSYRKPYGYNVGENKVTYASEVGGYNFISNGTTWKPLLNNGFISNIAGAYIGALSYNQCVDIKTYEYSGNLGCYGLCVDATVAPISYEFAYKFSYFCESLIGGTSSEIFAGPCFREYKTSGEIVTSTKMVCCGFAVKRNGSSFKPIIQFRYYDESVPYSQYEFRQVVPSATETNNYELSIGGCENIFIKAVYNGDDVDVYISYYTNNNWILIDTIDVSSFFSSRITQVGFVSLKVDGHATPMFMISEELTMPPPPPPPLLDVSTNDLSPSISVTASVGATYSADWGDGVDSFVGTGVSQTVSHTYSSGVNTFSISFDDASDIIVFNANNSFFKRFIQSPPRMFTGDMPDISGCVNLVQFGVEFHDFSGTISDLSSNIYLQTFSCGNNNSLSGSIPDLSNNTALTSFQCYWCNLSGAIPSLSNNTALTMFRCHYNNLTSYTPSTLSVTLTYFSADNNNLSQTDIDQILFDFNQNLISRPASGNIILDGNTAPSALGYTYRDNLVAHGWSVSVD